MLINKNICKNKPAEECDTYCCTVWSIGTVPASITWPGRIGIAQSLAVLARSTWQTRPDVVLGSQVVECARRTWILVGLLRPDRAIVTSWADVGLEVRCCIVAVVPDWAGLARTLGFYVLICSCRTANWEDCTDWAVVPGWARMPNDWVDCSGWALGLIQHEWVGSVGAWCTVVALGTLACWLLQVCVWKNNNNNDFLCANIIINIIYSR